MTLQRLASGLLIAAGLVLSLLAALVYSERLGFTDTILVDDNQLAVRFSRASPLVRTPIPVGDIYTSLRRIAPIGVLATAVVVVVAARLTRRSVGRVVRRWPRGWQGFVAATLFAGALTTFLPVGDHGRALALYSIGASLGFACVLSGIWWAGQGSTATRVFEKWCLFASAAGTVPRYLVLWLTGGALSAAVVTSLAVFGGVPHVVDGVSQLFQARTLGAGRLAFESHSLPVFFDLDTVVNNGRWFSQYTPGHAVLLLAGNLLGAPWLINPLLGAATVPALYALGKATYGASIAALATLLLVTSPFFLLMSSEYYSHASAFLFLTLFLHQYVRVVTTSRARHALAGGVWLGLGMLSRPLTALAIAVPCAVHAVLMARTDSDLRRLRQLVPMGAVTLAFVGLLLIVNFFTTGGFLTFGYSQAAGLGFGLSDGIAWLRTLGRLSAINNDLLGWPVPMLVLPLLLFLGTRPTHWDYLFVGIFISLLAAYAPSGYADREFGPRYLYEAIGSLLLLSSRGLAAMHEVVGRFATAPLRVERIRAGVGVGVATALVLACVLSWPPRLGFYASPSWVWAYPHEAVQKVRTAKLENAVVFVRGDRLWAALFLDNTFPVTEASPVIYAEDRGAQNRQLADRYPTRRYFVADSSGLTPFSP